jgi:hypothetical protein
MEKLPLFEELDAPWVGPRLGVDDATSLTSTPIGSGQVANCHRLRLTRDGAPPIDVIAKVPSHDAVSRTTAAALHLYEREVAFYQELAAHVDTRTPRCFFAQRDEDDNFLLLLEDLGPAADVDQFTGVTLDMARRGLEALAGLHGPTSARSDLHRAPWLAGVGELLAPLYAAVLPSLFEQFLERYAQRIDERTRSTVEALKERLDLYSGYVTPHPCVTHGDFRTDNLLIEAADGAVAVAVVDWQTVAVASPLLDVAYFLTTSLSPEDCARHETDLLDHYLERLARYDVRYSSDVARHEYARYTLQPVLMLVAASVYVEQTERGDDMFLEMIGRGVAAASRWDALDELERHAAGQ